MGRGNKKATSIYMTPRVKNVLELAVQVANRMNHNYVGTEHILLGLLSDGGGVAVGILRAMNIRTDDIVEAIRHILGSSTNGNHSGQEGANNNGDLGELTDFATDLNESAKQGKLILLLVAIQKFNELFKYLVVELKIIPFSLVNLV